MINNSSFDTAIMSANGILQKQQYIHGSEKEITRAPHSLVPTILHEFHDSKCHQGTIHTCEVNRRSYWWPKLQQDIVKYIGKCNLCAKHLPNMARYPQQHLEIPKIPMVLAIDTIGHLSITSKDNHMFYMLTILMKFKSIENVVQAYLSGILAHKGRSVAILSDNGTKFKNKILNEVYDQLGIKMIYSNLFHPQGNAKVENVHNFLKRILTKFWIVVI